MDVGSDVAVIKVDPGKADLKPLPLGDSDKVVVGEPVVAIGNPLGYDFSITSGIVSATGRSLQAPNGQTIPNGIQTDAAINQGNSGGPLIDNAGKVIGINEQIASSGGGNDGLGFAVPINTAIRSLEQIKANGKVTYAWMGVSLKTLTSDIAGMFNMQSQGGALVEQSRPTAPPPRRASRPATRTSPSRASSSPSAATSSSRPTAPRSRRPTTSSPSSAPRSRATRSRSRSSATARRRSSRSRWLSVRATSDSSSRRRRYAPGTPRLPHRAGPRSHFFG